MSKHNNVNPDHYKAGGRERPGHQVAKAPQQPEAANREAKERWLKRGIHKAGSQARPSRKP
jgi:hypothetical protein